MLMKRKGVIEEEWCDAKVPRGAGVDPTGHHGRAEYSSTNRYTGGVDTYLQVITAQTIALQNERNNVDILRRRMDASALLIKALGGGWSVTDLPKEASLR
jgi:hypothetical protein